MKRLSKILESVWTDMEDRGAGETIKKEDGEIVKRITIDGVEYKFTDRFWGMGDTYVEEYEQDWNCFGFKKNQNGSTVITGDTEDVGKFSDYNDEFDDREDYDVYYLKEFEDRDKFIHTLIENGSISKFEGPKEIQDIILDYTNRIIDDNHMSEYAQHRIFDISLSDINETFAIYPVSNLESQDIPDEYNLDKNDIIAINCISYPQLGDETNPWSEAFYRDIVDAYTNLGWVQLDYEVDPYGGWPGYEDAVMFVKVKDGVEVKKSDDDEGEDDEEYDDEDI